MTSLTALPQKTRVPFEKLLANGGLDEESLNDICLAGVLDKTVARNPNKLLGFAVGYLFLKSLHVPVKDVLKMANSLDKAINIEWSPNRWKVEHDRLSRAITLKKLAEDNVAYDVSKYDTLLPPNLKGYLIRSSRRLGMEGLRQRHCVASRHNSLLHGHYAIGVVFVDHVRWTVTITDTGIPDSPLRISEMRTRLNGTPSKEMREAILNIFGIKDTKVMSDSVSSDTEGFNYLENLRRILPVLREHDVGEVTVYFSGYGDSGSVDDASYDIDLDDKSIQVELATTERHFNDGQWVVRRRVGETSLSEAIIEIAESYIDETGVDYYNGDGGYGELRIDVAEGSVSLEVNQRYTESTCQFDRTIDITTGDIL